MPPTAQVPSPTTCAQANQLGFANGHFSVCPSAGGTPVTIP